MIDSDQPMIISELRVEEMEANGASHFAQQWLGLLIHYRANRVDRANGATEKITTELTEKAEDDQNQKRSYFSAISAVSVVISFLC